MNWTQFFEMGGYALYVWGSYGITALLLAVEVMMVRGRRKRALTDADLEQIGEARETTA